MHSFPNFELVRCSMFIPNYCILTFIQAYQEADKMVWYSHIFKNFPQFSWSIQRLSLIQWGRNRWFLEFSCFSYDPKDVGNLISDSFAFSKFSLYIWKFLIHILLKPRLEEFEHYLVTVQNDCNCVVIWTFFGTDFLWDWNENWPFPVLWPLLSFEICWHIECSTLTASSFRIWNSSARILSPPLALFIVMLPKALLTPHSRMSVSRWVLTPSCYLDHYYYYFFCVFLSPLVNIFCFCYVCTVSVIYCAHFWIKYSLDSFNFLEKLFSLSHSTVFLYFFTLLT